jgi:hypothetical protein
MHFQHELFFMLNFTGWHETNEFYRSMMSIKSYYFMTIYLKMNPNNFELY